MSLNFSIDSILGHEDQEASSSSGPTSVPTTAGSALPTSNDLCSMANQLSQFHRNLTALSSSFESPASSTAAALTTLSSPTLNHPYGNSSASTSGSNVSNAPPTGPNGSNGPNGPQATTSPRLNYELAQLNQLNQQLSPFGQLARFQYLQKVHSLYAAAAAANTSGLNASGLNPNLITSLASRTSDGSLAHDPNATAAAGNEQRFSPISDQSLEILLQYEDSEDNARAGRLLLANASQFEQMHKMSACSSNSSESSASDNGQSGSECGKRHLMYSSEMDTSADCDLSVGRAELSAQDADNGDTNSASGSQFGKQQDKDAPLCTKCKLHGIRNEVRGHKKKCPMKDCGCELCVLTDYGKRLRGKKAKKVVPNLSSTGSGASLLLDSLAASVRAHPNASNASDLGTLHTGSLPNLNLSSMNLPNLNLLSNQSVSERTRMIVNSLKERLQQEGLEFDQELCRLKDSVLYLLLGQFDKGELYSKFVVEM